MRYDGGMLYVYTGTDREKSRAAMNAAVEKSGLKIVRITDAHSLDDVRAGLQGAGMFGEQWAVVLDGVLCNDDLSRTVLGMMPVMKSSPDEFFILEEKMDAVTKKTVGKYAEKIEVFDLPGGKKKDSGIFVLADALKRGDKKTLWVEYQRALARGDVPEAIHGVLFWGAKDMFLKSRPTERGRASRLIASLAELPHEARRRGCDLEYALERYVLGINKA